MPSFVRSGAALAVNSQTASSQTRSSITGLADGGFVVAWQTANIGQDGSGSAIKLQRYTAQGVAVGAETLVNNVAAGDQSWGRVTSLASGGFVVTWESADAAQDGNGTAIKARLFDAAGAAVGGEFLVNGQAVTVTNVREGNTITGTSGTNTISTTSTVPGQPLATQLEDTIYGMGGADTISGAGGEDIIDGGAANDTITGGLAADLLIGGLGADRFNYGSTAESGTAAADTIQDFSRNQGDKINLNAIDANSNAGGNQNFAFIGAAAFSGVAGQLRFEQIGGNTFVSADVNGDRIADLHIRLDGPITPIASDFIL